MKKPTNPIRTIRLAAGLTQEVAAKRAGLPQSAWSAIERRPSLDATKAQVVCRIANALGIGVESLIGGGK